MNRPIIFLYLLWLLSALSDVSEYCYIWQLKTYLLSRFRDFLSTVQGRAYWRSYRTGIRYGLALILFLLSQTSFFRGHAWSLVYPFLLADLLYTAYLRRKKRLHTPHLNAVSVAIVSLSVFFEAAALFFVNDIRALFLAVLLRFAIVSLLCALIEIPRQIMITVNLRRAATKLKAYPNLTIIAITGSYGKSTTKEFLATLLSQKYRVAKTPENVNADVGIGKFILRTDLRNIDILIVEMGAYRRGHIARVCKYVKPTMSILTAINEQHVSLFGSINDTQQAKYEILRALSTSGLGIVNNDNPYCTEFLHTLHVPVRTFGRTVHGADCELAAFKLEQTGGVATIRVLGKELILLIPTQIVPYIMNVLAVVLVAVEKGLSTEQIQKGIEQLVLPAHGIHIYSYGSATVIDDSYSSNTDGFALALGLLKSFPSSRKKVLLTRGMIELGNMHTPIHERIGHEIALSADEVIIITPDAAEAITRGIREKNNATVIENIYDPKAIVDRVKKYRDTSTVLLIENRIPAPLKQELAPYHAKT